MTDREMFLNRKYYEDLYKEGILSEKNIKTIRAIIFRFLRRIGS